MQLDGSATVACCQKIRSFMSACPEAMERESCGSCHSTHPKPVLADQYSVISKCMSSVLCAQKRGNRIILCPTMLVSRERWNCRKKREAGRILTTLEATMILFGKVLLNGPWNLSTARTGQNGHR